MQLVYFEREISNDKKKHIFSSTRTKIAKRYFADGTNRNITNFNR